MFNIICLKHGTKYGPEYVNNLNSMVKRHITLPYTFYCLTEDTTGINTDINILPLPVNSKFVGWWWKPYAFKEGLFPLGTVNFFIDLDMVIVKNIDKLLAYLPNEFIGLEDVGRVFGAGRKKLGSAVLRWDANTYTDIWNALDQDPTIMQKFIGDQDYIWHYYKDKIKFFPSSWIRSYKWEVRTRDELVRFNNRLNFRDIRSPVLDPEIAILAFHGSPDPHEVKDPVIVDNWR